MSSCGAAWSMSSTRRTFHTASSMGELLSHGAAHSMPSCLVSVISESDVLCCVQHVSEPLKAYRTVCAVYWDLHSRFVVIVPAFACSSFAMLVGT